MPVTVNFACIGASLVHGSAILVADRERGWRPDKAAE